MPREAPPWVETEADFRRRLEEEVVRGRHFRHPFALAMVRCAPAHDGAVPLGEPGPGWLERVRAALRPVDRLAAVGPECVQVLLPEVGREEALRRARGLVGSEPTGPWVLRIGLALFPEAGEGSEQILAHSRAALERADAESPVAVVPEWEEPREESPNLVAGHHLRGVLALARRVAPTRLPVLVRGETGTGKEELARLLHEYSPRRGRSLVRVNCGAIARELLESTLFGHERGAFTGAHQQRKGLFEEADGGTLFLDEVGELPLAAQVALLRVLETGAFIRVGSSREVKVDVRVVAATHRELEAMVAAGTFREDLYYRLSPLVLRLPPLRERVEEVEPLVHHFLRRANAAHGRGVQGLEPGVLERLRAYAWPGNVRELRNVVEHAVVMAGGSRIGPGDLPAPLREPGGPRLAVPGGEAPRLEPADAEPLSAANLRERVLRYEARLLLEALRATGWKRNEAARRLGLPVRTLNHRMKVLSVRPPSP